MGILLGTHDKLNQIEKKTVSTHLFINHTNPNIMMNCWIQPGEYGEYESARLLIRPFATHRTYQGF